MLNSVCTKMLHFLRDQGFEVRNVKSISKLVHSLYVQQNIKIETITDEVALAQIQFRACVLYLNYLDWYSSL